MRFWLTILLMTQPLAVLALQTTAPDPAAQPANDSVIRAFHDLTDQLNEMVAAYNRGEPPTDLDLLQVGLLNLARSLRAQVASQVDPTAQTNLILPAKERALFRQAPILPAELKRDGRWFFEPIRFDLVPTNLYVFGIRFQADVTIRIQSVTLYFRDGSSRTEKSGVTTGDGNGQAFDKGRFLPWVRSYADGEPRRAKRLVAIEILGTAQDGNATANLAFELDIPDPAATPSSPALLVVNQYIKTWIDQTVTANRLNQYLRDCRDLAAALNIPYCFDTPAID